MMSLWMGLPFVILLIGISIGPTGFPKIWHKVELLVVLGCIGLTVACYHSFYGLNQTIVDVQHILANEYIPFIVALYALYTVSTSLRISIEGSATPLKNTLFLLGAAPLASLIGTTGASMLLIHPFLRWNRHHPYKSILVVFFILTVSNIGGSLSPLGDPPLFVGYLLGVPFEWPFVNLGTMFLISMMWLLGVFLVFELYVNKTKNIGAFKIHLQGGVQLLFIPVIVLILMYAKGEMPFLREILLLLVSGASFLLDKKYLGFLSQKGHWDPVFEVGRVFLGIFICVSPISIMLQQGVEGPFGSFLSVANSQGMPNNTFYFWMTGIFSAFLDNAPTYLIFFKMIGDSNVLQNHPVTLQAISIASIFFGAMTYIGNAPNFMVRSIAKQHGVSMPSFLGYMVLACLILLPLCGFISFVWFR